MSQRKTAHASSNRLVLAVGVNDAVTVSTVCATVPTTGAVKSYGVTHRLAADFWWDFRDELADLKPTALVMRGKHDPGIISDVCEEHGTVYMIPDELEGVEPMDAPRTIADPSNPLIVVTLKAARVLQDGA